MKQTHQLFKRAQQLLGLITLTVLLSACGGGGGGGTPPPAPPATVLSAESNVGAVTLSWNDTTSATRYDLYVATEPDCDTDNYTACADGTLLTDVTSPYTHTGLTNGQNVWFKLESINSEGRSFSNEASARPDKLVTNRPVRAIAVAADGTTYLGGDFTTVGIKTGTGVPISLDHGRVNGAFPEVNGGIFATVADGNGGWYIGGDFTLVDGVSRNRLAHIRANGTLGSWDPDADDIVFALAVSDNTVYAGGRFTTINSTERNHLAAISTEDKGTLIGWNLNGANNTVFALALSGNALYVGGDFTSISGIGRQRLAAISTDNVGTPIDWNFRANRRVSALALSGNILYVGGDFDTINDITRHHLAAISTDNVGTLTDWNPRADDWVNALVVSGSTVYAAGGFTAIGGIDRHHLAAIDIINTNGTLTSSLTDWNPGANNPVNALALSDSTLYVGGNFSTISDIERNHLAAINTDNVGTLTDWNPSANNWVYALAISGNTVYAGGRLTMIGGIERHRLAAIGADGTLTSWNPSANRTVNALALSGSALYVGGHFSTISGIDRHRLAAISTDNVGTLTDWNPRADDWVNALAVSGSTVYAGGRFTAIGGIDRHHLAAIDIINTNGTLTSSLTDWNPNANNTVNALALSGSTVYVGGHFTTISGIDRHRLAAIDIINTNGTLTSSLTGWNPGANNTVNALARSGNTLYVGGGFTAIGGIERHHLAAIDTINTNGILTSSLTGWNPSANVNGSVTALARSGNTLYVGGGFTTISGIERHRLAAIDTINTNGTLTSSLTDWNPKANDWVFALAVSGSALYAGGRFTAISNKPTAHFAAIPLEGSQTEAQ